MKYLLSLVVLISIISCQSNTGGSSELIKVDGFDVKKIVTNGTTTPQKGDYVHFNLKVLDDKDVLLDKISPQRDRSTIQIPAMDTPNAQKNPIMTLLQQMSQGDSAILMIPADSIPMKSPEFENAEFIQYAIRIDQIQTMEEFKNKKIAAEKEGEVKVAEIKALVEKYNNGESVGTTETLDGGLKLIMIEKGSGAMPEIGKNISVHYAGFLKDMSGFDNSFKRGEPFQFTLGQGMVIQGWDKGFAQIPSGSKAILDIPYDLAYGEDGRPSIPAKSDLLFYVEMQ